jgi:hypothetical protein
LLGPIQSASVSPPGAAADPGGGPPQLTIFGATYSQADVTALVRSLVDAGTQSLSLTLGDQSLGGDPWPNNVKTFVIVAAYTGCHSWTSSPRAPPTGPRCRS